MMKITSLFCQDNPIHYFLSGCTCTYKEFGLMNILVGCLNLEGVLEFVFEPMDEDVVPSPFIEMHNQKN